MNIPVMVDEVEGHLKMSTNEWYSSIPAHFAGHIFDHNFVVHPMHLHPVHPQLPPAGKHLLAGMALEVAPPETQNILDKIIWEKVSMNQNDITPFFMTASDS